MWKALCGKRQRKKKKEGKKGKKFSSNNGFHAQSLFLVEGGPCKGRIL